MKSPIRFAILSRLFLISLTLGVLSAIPHSLHAQSLGGGSVGVTLTSNPEFPGANSPVEISLDDYQLNTVGATITWYVDSVEQTAFKNSRSMTLTTGALGKKSVVSVVLTRSDAPQLKASLTLVPTEVHIILEANTYVPDFYKGRALPSIGSQVRTIAIVEDGTRSAPNVYTYTWSEENTILFGGPVKGKNVYEFTMPRYGTKRLFVDVADATGNTIGRGAVSLVATDPEMHFYEQSPLRGLSQKVVSDPLPFIGEETTIYGEPYFISSQMNTGDASFTWKIDGVKTNQNSAVPNAITLQRVGDSGATRVSLDIITNRQIPDFIKGAFNIAF